MNSCGDDLVLLTCNVQTYAWGKIGSSSLVARQKKGASSKWALDEASPYAEYWMGTHPNNPSYISGTDELFCVYLARNTSSVGVVPDGYDKDNLPFLFKILSIGKTLSIQVHPDKDFASELHASRPDVYKDPNHKPEMSLALTKFEAMCGLRPIEDVLDFAKELPELAAMCDLGDFTPKTLDTMWRTFLTCDEAAAQTQLQSLLERLKERQVASPATAGSIDPYELSLRLMAQFPGDRGAFCPFLLKCISLQPGEAFFMGPNQPHAYVSGDCLEVMAPSDNVIRAALTPKYKDIETLINTINYTTGDFPHVHPIEVDSNTSTYRPPFNVCPEFELNRLHYKGGSSGKPQEYTLQQIDCCSVVLVMDGSLSFADTVGRETTVSAGSVVSVSANANVTLRVASDETTLYRASRNLGGKS